MRRAKVTPPTCSLGAAHCVGGKSAHPACAQDKIDGQRQDYARQVDKLEVCRAAAVRALNNDHLTTFLQFCRKKWRH